MLPNFGLDKLSSFWVKKNPENDACTIFDEVCGVAVAKVFDWFFQKWHRLVENILGYHITKFQAGAVSITCSAAFFSNNV